MGEVAVRISNLSCEFGSTKAIDSVSLEVPRGIIFGLLGPNGAGKTTMIRVLLGLVEPAAGEVEVLGLNVKYCANEVRFQVGALLERSGLYDRLSAEDNLEFFGRIWRLSPVERTVRIKEALSRFGLWERRKEPVHSWSRGMRQKLAIARVLLHRPKLVLLDEPSAGLDPVSAVLLQNDILALAKEGITVFLTSHNMAEVEKIGSLVAVIRDGRLLKVGSPADLRATDGNLRVTVTGHGFDNGLVSAIKRRLPSADPEIKHGSMTVQLGKEDDITPLIRMIVDSGVIIKEVLRERNSLEETYIRLMEESNSE